MLNSNLRPELGPSWESLFQNGAPGRGRGFLMTSALMTSGAMRCGGDGVSVQGKAGGPLSSARGGKELDCKRTTEETRRARLQIFEPRP